MAILVAATPVAAEATTYCRGMETEVETYVCHCSRIRSSESKRMACFENIAIYLRAKALGAGLDLSIQEYLADRNIVIDPLADTP